MFYFFTNFWKTLLAFGCEPQKLLLKKQIIEISILLETCSGSKFE